MPVQTPELLVICPVCGTRVASDESRIVPEHRRQINYQFGWVWERCPGIGKEGKRA